MRSWRGWSWDDGNFGGSGLEPLSAVTLKRYSGAGDALEVPDLVIEMRKAGDEVVDGNMGRVERMLANQAMTLDAIFNDGVSSFSVQ